MEMSSCPAWRVVRIGRRCESVRLQSGVHPIGRKAFGDLDDVGAHEGFATGEEDDGGPDRCEVLRNLARLTSRALLHVCVGIDDVALDAAQDCTALSHRTARRADAPESARTQRVGGVRL